MPTYDWPAERAWDPMSGALRLRPISLLSASPYTASLKAVSIGQVWVMEASWNSKGLDLGHEIQSFLNRLEGPSNPVRLYDWWRQVPRLLATAEDPRGEPFDDDSYFDDGFGWLDAGYAPLLIADAVRGDKQVTMSGLPVSAPAFRRGDLFGLGGCLYEVTVDAAGDADGEATVFFQPGLRAGAAAGDPVSLYLPRVPMRMLPESEAALQRMSHDHTEPFTLTFVEDVP